MQKCMPENSERVLEKSELHVLAANRGIAIFLFAVITDLFQHMVMDL
jgi:hypothetical protein